MDRPQVGVFQRTARQYCRLKISMAKTRNRQTAQSRQERQIDEGRYGPGPLKGIVRK